MNADELIGFSTADARYQALLAILRGEGNSVAQTHPDWNALVVLAAKERVAPLVYDALMRHPVEIPADARQYFARAYRHTLSANLRRLVVLRDALAYCNATGIPVIVLKGIALAECVYGKLGARPMVDVDLLVKQADAARAVVLLRNAGFREGGKPELRPGFDLEFRAEKELLSPRPLSRMVEIHWRLSAPVFTCRYVDHAAVWARATPIEIEKQPAFVLGAEDWLLHQAAHAVYKHRDVRLLDLYDADRLVLHFGERLDWEMLLSIGAHYRWLPALALVLGQAQQLFGTPVPARVLERARAFRLDGLECRLMDWWLTPSRSERHHIVVDWLAAPSVAARVRFLWAYLVPSRAYIRAQYAPQSGRQLLWLYLIRLFHEMGFARPSRFPFLNRKIS